jgi:hypothetical protein
MKADNETIKKLRGKNLILKAIIRMLIKLPAVMRESPIRIPVFL